MKYVTFVPLCYLSGPFLPCQSCGKLALGDRMGLGSMDTDQRRGARTKAVLPVRVKGKDSTGKAFEDLVHTLDVTPDGVRLGSVRRELSVLEEITVFYRQRRIQFRVVWTKKMLGTSEFQVGLQALTQDSEAWGLSFPDYKRQPVLQPVVAQASGAA
jgi:hypothetical protein